MTKVRAKLSFNLMIVMGTIILSGCSTVELQEDFFATRLPEPERKGIYHKVNPGETLWRIAQTYEVPLNDIIKTNNIPNAAQVEEGQLVFIPEATETREILLDQEETKNEFVWPIKGTLLSFFKQTKNNCVNKGIDIQAREGQEVKAARTGRVTFADYLSGYGQTVILNHLDGYYTVYSHNKELLVKKGDLVFKDKSIALVGSSNNQTYLHFEVRKNSIEDNPLYYLP